MKKGYKLCPFCGEEIREIATKCRFCGEFLEEKKKNKKVQNIVETTQNKDSKINKKVIIFGAIYIIGVAITLGMIMFTMSPARRGGVMGETIAIVLFLILIWLIFRKPIGASSDYDKNIFKKEDKQGKWNFLIIGSLVLFFLVAGYNYFTSPINKHTQSNQTLTRKPIETMTINCFEYTYSKGKAVYGNCENFEIFMDGIAINGEFTEMSFETAMYLKQAFLARDKGVEPFMEIEIKNSNKVISIQGIYNFSADLNEFSKEMFGKDINILTDEELVGIEKLLRDYYHVLGNYDLYKDDMGNVKITSDMEYEGKLSLYDLDLLALPGTIIDFNVLFTNVLGKEFGKVYPNEAQLEQLSDEINKQTGYKDFGQARYKLYLTEGHLILRDLFMNGDV